MSKFEHKNIMLKFFGVICRLSLKITWYFQFLIMFTSVSFLKVTTFRNEEKIIVMVMKEV